MSDATVAVLESTVASLQATVNTLAQAISNTTADLDATRADTADNLTTLKGSVDTFYLLYSGTLVFFMQARARRPPFGGPRPHLNCTSLVSRLDSACSRRDRSG